MMLKANRGEKQGEFCQKGGRGGVESNSEKERKKRWTNKRKIMIKMNIKVDNEERKK